LQNIAWGVKIKDTQATADYFSEILSYLEAFNMVAARGTERDLQQTRNYNKSIHWS